MAAAVPLQNGPIFFSSNRDGNGEIYRLNAGEKEPEAQPVNLTNNASVAAPEDYAPAVSRDGRLVAFWRGNNSRSDLWIMNADGTRQRQITRGLDISSRADFGPTGNLVFSVRDENYASALYVLDSIEGTPRRLSIGARHAFGPIFSPDGRQTAFTGIVGEQGGILIMNPDGSNLRALVNDTEDTKNYASFWTPDGSEIVYSAVRDTYFCGGITANPRRRHLDVKQAAKENPVCYETKFYAVRVDTKAVREITREGIAGIGKVSPDGRRIVFSRTSPDGNSSDVYTADLDGRNEIRLTVNPAIDGVPVWGVLPR